MATRKSDPTLAALNAQIAALQTQADVLRKKEVMEVIAKVKEAIAHYGLTAGDLGFGKALRPATLPVFGSGIAEPRQHQKISL